MTGATSWLTCLQYWDWTADTDGPIVREDIVTHDVQTSVRFHPGDSSQVVTNGTARVVFWRLVDGRLKFHAPPIMAKEFQGGIGAFTTTVFLPVGNQAVTGTVEGDLVIWETMAFPDPGAHPTDQRITKKMRLFQPGVAVTQLQVFDSFIVAGTSDGAVRFYDFKCRILAWYEDLDLGPITSLTFTSSPAGKQTAEGEVRIPNFIVGTSKGRIALVNAAVFERIDPEQVRVAGLGAMPDLFSAVEISSWRALVAPPCGLQRIRKRWWVPRRGGLLLTAASKRRPSCRTGCCSSTTWRIAS